jgi:hypothetical protein
MPRSDLYANWDCKAGTADEDHAWKLVPGDRDVGEGDHMECKACGETREATEQEIADSYHDSNFGE